jgi:predicted RNA-binding protein associated with RNAse of E/G family
MKGIESMEEFFLDIFFAGKELDIVDKDTVKIAVFILN